MPVICGKSWVEGAFGNFVPLWPPPQYQPANQPLGLKAPHYQGIHIPQPLLPGIFPRLGERMLMNVPMKTYSIQSTACTS